MTDSFDGFSRGTVDFLRELGEHNRKAWFDEHRRDYEACYLEPAKAFVEVMGAALLECSPAVHAEARVNGSIFRINRDTRFSADKTPYKDHLDLTFWIGPGRSRERPGYFFRLTADALHLGAGMHGFPKPMLEAYREAVDDPRRGGELERALATAEAAGAVADGLHYKRVPQGYDPDHPRGELLKYNALHAGFEVPIPDEAYSVALVDYCLERFRPLAPLAEWVAGL